MKLPSIEQACILCGSHELSSWGGWNTSTRNDIGGIQADLYPLHRYQVMSCNDCGAATKTPCPTQDALNHYCESASAGQWGGGGAGDKRRFGRMERMVQQVRPGYGRVLDFGCSTGALLSHWSPSWRKYGVEPCEQAAIRAQQKGIVVYSDLDELARSGTSYDVIVMTDVIEHLPNPSYVLGVLLGVLSERGCFLIETGKIDSLFFRISKGSYWYCDIPEHVCFYGEKSVRYLAREFNLDVRAFVKVPHMTDSWRYARFAMQFSKFVFFNVIKSFTKIVGCFSIKRTTQPSFTALRDHMVVVLEKGSRSNN